MESSCPTTEPFKATKLWNMLIQEFRTGMPRKRHRRGLRGRQHDNCFTTTEAVDWLHSYLQTCDRFGPWVTKSQTVSLLEKFLQTKVIQEVKGSSSSSKGTPRKKFDDNGDLYRFVHVSPIKKLRSALSSRTNLRSSSRRSPLKTRNDEPTTQRALSYDNPMFSIHDDVDQCVSSAVPECRLVQRTLTNSQKDAVWKSATITRLQRLLWLPSLASLLNPDLIEPRYVQHNVIHVSKNGVVLVPKDQDDLPHWVLSAMKCLANWPNSPDSSLPDYPGFERDVFKTVSNYFNSLPEPLLTHHLYDLITESFVTAERRDRGLYPGAESLSETPKSLYGMTSFQSVENLMLDMTSGGLSDVPEVTGVASPGGRRWYGDRRGLALGRRDSRSRPVDSRCYPPSIDLAPTTSQPTGVRRSSSMVVPSDGHYPLIMRRCISEPKTEQGVPAVSYDVSSRRRGEHQRQCTAEHDGVVVDRFPRQRVESTPNPPGRYEYPQRRCPVDLLPDSRMHISRPLLYGQSESGGLVATQPADNQSHDNYPPNPVRRHFGSMNDIGGTNTDSRPVPTKERPGSLLVSRKFGSASELIQKLFKKKNGVAVGDDGKSSGLARQRLGGSTPDLASNKENNPYNSGGHYGHAGEATKHCQQAKRVGQSYRREMSSNPDISPRGGSDVMISTEVRGQGSNSGQQQLLIRCDSSASLYLTDDKTYTAEVLKLCCLLLPPVNRRKLHLVLKLMTRMEGNEQLALSSRKTTRQIVLKTFSRSILCSQEEIDYNEILSTRIVEYLMDNHVIIFSQPDDLKNDVDDRLVHLRREQIQYAPQQAPSTATTTHCLKVSGAEYEAQKLNNSQRAIADLLDVIINDQRMATKDKKKKLKQFQQTYPDIYARRLPTTAVEAQLFPDKPKLKQPIVNVKRSFTKLKSLR